MAKNLQLARMAAGLTQIELSARSGVTRATIAQLESATGDPCLSTIIKLATVLGISPMLLLMRDTEFAGLARLIREGKLPDEMLTPDQAQQVAMMLATGVDKQKANAAKVLTGAATLCGLSAVGSVIGAGLLPLAGGALGAALGYWLNSGNPAKPEDKKPDEGSGEG